MKKLSCIIADDEPIARQILQNYIEETPNLKLLASCKNAFEVMEILQQHRVDILFLDINMPKLTGLSLLKTLREKPNVIKSLFVKSNKKIIKVNFNDISHVEAYGNYVKIYTDKMILTPLTLSEFLKKLPDSFIRIHKSFIINFNSLKLIDGNQVVLQDHIKIPIGKSYRKQILDRI